MAARAATIQEVRDRLGPVFVDPPITDDVVQLALDDVACLISVAAFGECASQAQSWAAAHCVASSPASWTISVPEGAGAQITSHANGPASRAYSVPTLDDGLGWTSTLWGRKAWAFILARHGCGSAVLARTSRSIRRAC
jgi:hypothetical protein